MLDIFNGPFSIAAGPVPGGPFARDAVPFLSKRRIASWPIASAASFNARSLLNSRTFKRPRTWFVKRDASNPRHLAPCTSVQ